MAQAARRLARFLSWPLRFRPVTDRGEAVEEVDAQSAGSGLAGGTGAEGDASPEAQDDRVVDELPEDLDAAGYVGPYMFPDNNRRRVPGVLYLLTAAVCVAIWALVDSPYVNRGFLFAAGLLAVMGIYQIVAGWNLNIDERGALLAAARQVGFPIGHASAQLTWRGLLSRPMWRILVYSAEDPPARRGLLLVDGVDGSIIEHFVEANPEDWSEFS